MPKRAVTLAAVCLLLAGPAAAAEFDVEIKHDGATRRAEVIAPDRPADAEPAPAILVLHGGGGSPRRARRYTDFTFAQKGWVEVYPAGLDREWNDGRVGADGRHLRPADDVGFLRALIARLAADGLVDPARVYVSGASNGGMMTMRLACDAPDLVAGAAIVIASWPVGLECASDRPIPALFLHGTEDPLVPYKGGRVVSDGGKDRGSVLSAAETLAIWSARNRCGVYREIALPDNDPSDGTHVNRRVYEGCAAPLVQYVVEGGGHTWPGRPNRPLLGLLLGPTSQDMDLSAEVTSFFLALDAAR